MYNGVLFDKHAVSYPWLMIELQMIRCFLFDNIKINDAIAYHAALTAIDSQSGIRVKVVEKIICAHVAGYMMIGKYSIIVII